MAKNDTTAEKQTEFKKPEREFWYCSWTNKGDQEAWRLKKKKSNDAKYFKNQEDAIAYYMSLEVDGYLWFHANGKYVRNIKTIRSLETKETIVFDSFDSEEKQKEQERRLEEAFKRNQEILQKQWEEKQKELDQKLSKVEEAKKDLELKSEVMDWKLQEMNELNESLNENAARFDEQASASQPQQSQSKQQADAGVTQLSIYNEIPAQPQQQIPVPYPNPATAIVPMPYPTNSTQYFYGAPQSRWSDRITGKVIALMFFTSLFICIAVIALLAFFGLIPWF
ncbi:Uncharacterised protein [Mycoplasmopsis californica]|uniref:Uncharacterized protein n=1 Tax=Mycoplasmopsis equigenitalium TaxID=114883 RepID=A0ABY5J0T7_9BACT|nr:hypothetical protein [Mycoplasmopsis equigenitalium]UUD36871.1 hypothetical protein NPA09_03165 [Mycoplasmopsis equigenitalium]VEU69834.1 Uncharacterised protein [Mycoplasmopsis californica]